MSAGPDETYQLSEQLAIVRDRAHDDKNAVLTIYSSLDPAHDARITAFSKFINVLNSVQLAFLFISKHLLYKQWWDAIALTPVSDSDKQIYANEYANFTKLAFVQSIFSSIESSLRLFLKAVDPSACNGGIAEFKSIYDCLLNSKLATSYPDGIVLLDLLRLVRNTIHNNGVYFDPRMRDISLTWKGQTFDFKQTKPVDFVIWEFLIAASDSLRELLRKVVEDASLRNITQEITDPFSHT